MNEIVELVQQWSRNKGLDKADSRGQFLKVVEEAGEVAAALCRSDIDALKDGLGDIVVTLIIYAQQNELKLDLNDVPTSFIVDQTSENSRLMSLILLSVVGIIGKKRNALYCDIVDCCCYLNIMASKHNLTLNECLQAAYDEISGRTGKMVNGIFVKSEDLPKPEYNQDVWAQVKADGAFAGYKVYKGKQGKLT